MSPVNVLDVSGQYTPTNSVGEKALDGVGGSSKGERNASLA
jgi:hypothetical protein